MFFSSATLDPTVFADHGLSDSAYVRDRFLNEVSRWAADRDLVATPSPDLTHIDFIGDRPAITKAARELAPALTFSRPASLAVWAQRRFR